MFERACSLSAIADTEKADIVRLKPGGQVALLGQNFGLRYLRAHWVEPVLVAQIKFTEWTTPAASRKGEAARSVRLA